MKTVTHYTKELLHIETELGIVNIRCSLADTKGRKVTSIEVIPENHFGARKVILRGYSNTRLIQLKSVTN